MIKVGIGVPSARDCKPDFARCLAMATSVFGNQGFNKHDVGLRFITMKGAILPNLRSTIAEQALKYDCTHLLFLDDDMQFPMETIAHLLARDVDIIGVNAAAKVWPPHGTCWKESGKRLITTKDSTGIEQVRVVGTGIMMIKMEVFRNLPKPWFMQGVRYDYLKDHLENMTHENLWRALNGEDGEDSWFCKHAQAHGFKVWCDHDLSKKVKHIGDFDYTIDLTDEYHGNAPQER